MTAFFGVQICKSKTHRGHPPYQWIQSPFRAHGPPLVLGNISLNLFVYCDMNANSVDATPSISTQCILATIPLVKSVTERLRSLR